MWRKMKNRVFLVSVFKNYFMFLRIKNTKNAFGKGSGFCSQCFLYIYIYIVCLFVCLLFREQKKHLCSLCFLICCYPYSHLSCLWFFLQHTESAFTITRLRLILPTHLSFPLYQSILKLFLLDLVTLGLFC